MLKYCPKREHFSYNGMVARTQLAALDNNANTIRHQAVVMSGEKAGKARYMKSYRKSNKNWVVRPIKEKKTYNYLCDMMEDVLRRCKDRTSAYQQVPAHIPRNIAPLPQPSKNDLIKQHRTRFYDG